MTGTVAVIGGGNMGGALIAGLVGGLGGGAAARPESSQATAGESEPSPVKGARYEASPVDGARYELSPVKGARYEASPVEGARYDASPVESARYDASQVLVVEHSVERAAHLRAAYGVQVVPLAEAVGRAATVLITVKPHHVPALLDDLASLVTQDQLVVSAAGGIRIAQIEAVLGPLVAVVRSMPNAAVALGEGMIAISPGSCAGEAELDRAQALFEPVGQVVRLPESQLDAVTALSGSGPAYFYYLAEALIDAGVLIGLPRALASQLVIQTAVGAGAMLRADEDPVALRAAVSSPGGMTIAAVHELEKRAVRGAVMSAVQAARDRSIAVGTQE
ncbi:pyrroline-5-carboxylate reductase [Streptomyces sp. SID13031]|uniref:pyrroline-5-carboxylate reductase n=1 Tax=Streptomyces sp. SID13031 TaxID=2706046 RepID=UPI0013CB77EB|nr:pyrroline-5-carboxylate reductase [Streptomyces sp. SID13031]NEA33954.1 pyrroline-5-carboxylate reductase [Streptomyces sp. SID13031]